MHVWLVGQKNGGDVFAVFLQHGQERRQSPRQVVVVGHILYLIDRQRCKALRKRLCSTLVCVAQALGRALAQEGGAKVQLQARAVSARDFQAFAYAFM